MQNKSVAFPASNNKKQNKLKKYVGLLLVVALVITGLYAFLVAQDTKENVFTLGKVKAELWENCDVNGINGLEDGESFGPEAGKEVTFTKEILPGETRAKQPYIKNTGDSDAWMYIVARVPLVTKGEYPDDVEKIGIKAYAAQDGYDSCFSANTIWQAIGADVDGAGERDTNDSKVPLFTLNEVSNEWGLIDSFKSTDGNIYYIYAGGKIPAGEETDALFNSVTLVDTSKLAEINGEGDSVAAIFMAGGNIVDSKLLNNASASLFTPDLPTGYTEWVTEAGKHFNANSSINVNNDCYIKINSEIINPNKVIISAVPESSDSYRIEGDGSSLPVKLVPASTSSTAMISRNYVVETYNTITAEQKANNWLLEKSEIIVPNTNTYATPANFDHYLLYGLDFDMSPEKLMNFVKVQGNGYAVVNLTEYNREGTTATIDVREALDNSLVETFHFVIYGDVDGDSIPTAADCNIINKEGKAFEWSIPDTDDYNEYKHIAGDLNCDSRVTAVDFGVEKVISNDALIIEQSDCLQATTPAKLMPKTGSTTMVERDGIVETYNSFSSNDIKPYGVTSIITPSSKIYDTPANYESWFIYGLNTNLKVSALSNYIYVTNDGTYEVYNTSEELLENTANLGTGAIIKVKNRNSEIVEEFRVVIFGDINGDGYVLNTDSSAVQSELTERIWSEGSSKVNYKCKAADLDLDGDITNKDNSRIKSAYNYELTINQKTGYAGVPVKLVPSSSSSTAMIERNGVVETYNTFSAGDVRPYAVSTIKAPNSNPYGATNFDSYFIYGLADNLSVEDLADYISVSGDGRYEVTPSDSKCGTGSVVKVYNCNGTDNTSDDTLEEQFYIIIFGDIDGDARVTVADVSFMNSELSAPEPTWSASQSNMKYLKRAGDLNGDGAITVTDFTLLNNAAKIYGRNISQIIGQVS